MSRLFGSGNLGFPFVHERADRRRWQTAAAVEPDRAGAVDAVLEVDHVVGAEFVPPRCTDGGRRPISVPRITATWLEG
jgi:hypothetical protein